jgi:hypothetical protein
VLDRIVSGGQTGADRAALDAAIALGIACGGWVPLGRVAEDGQIPPQYHDLTEAPSAEPAVRTELNVRDSDATLVISRGEPAGGSALTLAAAARLRRPALHIDLAQIAMPAATRRLAGWLREVQPHTLNVAGPRASEDPVIYEMARTLLTAALAQAAGLSDGDHVDYDDRGRTE